MNIREELLNIFAQVGIFIDEYEYDEVLQIDSIQFVNVILEIEETFTITVDEEYMLYERLNSLSAFENMIMKTINFD